VYLTEAEAPAAVFPEADRFERRDIASTPELRRQISERLGETRPTVWESSYRVFAAYREGVRVGTAVIVEEIGKHRPITFIVGIGSDGRVADVAVMAYREPYGGEVRSSRFLRQYRGKGLADPLLPGRDVRNITGATLSARAIGRGVKKAIALLEVIREAAPEGGPARGEDERRTLPARREEGP
jgi:Na+-translocating ferredoxin:NAD+ oxidoreductase RnfG subunit